MYRKLELLGSNVGTSCTKSNYRSDRSLMQLDKVKCKVRHTGSNHPMNQYILETSFAKKVLVGIKLGMSQQFALVGEKADGTLSTSSQSAVCSSSEVILPLCSSFVKQNRNAESGWAPQYERDMDILEQVHQRATKMVK